MPVFIQTVTSWSRLRVLRLTLWVPPQVNDFVDDGTPADKHLRKIAIHVSAYITHIRTQLKQTIPKAIVHTLVRFAVLHAPAHTLLIFFAQQFTTTLPEADTH